jgi:hypothetical protein
MAKSRLLLLLCGASLVLAIVVPTALAQTSPPPADAVQQLEQIFGQPGDFLFNFNESITEKANSIFGLLGAAFGFSLVIRAFL